MSFESFGFTEFYPLFQLFMERMARSWRPRRSTWLPPTPYETQTLYSDLGALQRRNWAYWNREFASDIKICKCDFQIVGLEMANQILQAGERLVMSDVVKELRQYRHGSVQTDVQYVYMHRVIMGLAENKKAVKREEIAPFLESYENYVKTKG